MAAIWNVAGIAAPAYHAVSLFVHVLNAWLLLALLRVCDRLSGSPATALVAATFFAVHEGHQEAVMWFSAINELLLFFFGLAALVCWMRGRTFASAALFALALLSKESAVILLPLFVLVSPPRQWKRLWPLALLTGLAVASIAVSHENSFRFNDGSFSLAAPVWITWPQSFARLLWIWGCPSIAVIFMLAPREARRRAAMALAWIGISLLPYSFLAYSTRIPSRQTYLASAGLAILFGLAADHAIRAWPQHRRVLAGIFVLMLAHNAIYLWTKKRAQFVERAAPTDGLIALARRTSAPIYMQCFPLPDIVAKEAVRLAAGRSPDTLVWTSPAPSGAVTYCYRESR